MKLSRTAEYQSRYTPYAPGQAGFDAKMSRFRDADGNRMSKADFIEMTGKVDNDGVMLNHRTAPVSSAMERLEDLIGGIEQSYNRAKSFENLGKMPKAWPMPTEILAGMRLSEYFFRTEGDLAHALTLPMELALSNNIEIKCPDADMKRQLEELYDVDQLDLYGMMKSMWQCDEIYGQVFPLEIPSGNPETPLAAVTLLNPKYVFVGSPIIFGAAGDTLYPAGSTEQEADPRSGTLYGLLSQADKAWTASALQAEVHPMVYNCFGPQWNEQVARGLWIDLNPKYLHPITVNKLPWERYATPPLAKAFKSITTRKTFDELRRATFEGFKSQIFIFNVGTPDKPGSPKEMETWTGILNKIAGEHTNSLLARGNLTAKALVMQPLDAAMADETRHGLTLEIFRSLGVSMRLIAGESPSTRGGGSEAEIDVRMFIERLRFKQRQFERWEKGFRLRLAQMYYGAKAPEIEVMRQTTVRFQKPVLELQELIKGYLMPILASGAMSYTTFHSMSGLDHGTEVENRKREKESGEDELFATRPVSSQQYVGTETKNTNVPQDGRPFGEPEVEPRVEGGEERDYQRFLPAY